MDSLHQLWTFLVLCPCLASVSAYCTKFEFPRLVDNFTVTTPINEPVSIPFKLSTTNCTVQNFTIAITTPKDNGIKTQLSQCKLIIRGGYATQSFRPGCNVGKTKGTYSFSVPRDLSNGTWISWRTILKDKDIAPEVKIQYIVKRKLEEGTVTPTVNCVFIAVAVVIGVISLITICTVVLVHRYTRALIDSRPSYFHYRQ